MRPPHIANLLLILILMVAYPDRASAEFQDLVVNGGFETGNFTGWTLVGDSQNTFVDTSFPHNGTYASNLGQVGSLGSLSQALATTAGLSYTLSFWFAGDGNTPSEFLASIGGKSFLDLVNPPLDTIYRNYSYNFTATDSATLLSFGFRDDVFFMNLDDVSVIPLSSGPSVPEPTSMIPLGIGMVTLAGYSAYRRERAR